VLFVIVVFIVSLLLMFAQAESEEAAQLYQGIPLDEHLLATRPKMRLKRSTENTSNFYSLSGSKMISRSSNA
jgi:hypothetical protein